MENIAESSINIIAEGTRLEGKMVFDLVTRVHGTLVGEVEANSGSTLILSESAMVEGNIQGDIVLVDGFVRGDILAKTKVTVSGTGRVIGNIQTPSLNIEFGGYFEGKCTMESMTAPGPGSPNEDRALKPA